MNAGTESQKTPYWVWILVLTVFLVALGLASAMPGSKNAKIGTDESRIVSITEKNPALPEPMPDVRVSTYPMYPKPVEDTSALKPGPAPAHPNKAAPPARHNMPKLERLKIPMPTRQDLLFESLAATQNKPSDTIKEQESLPSFAYNSKTWTFTGSYVDTAEVDVTELQDTNTTGMKIYALAGGSINILFVHSNKFAEKLAIYR